MEKLTKEEAISLINNSKDFNDQLKGYLFLIDKEHNSEAMIALANIYYNNKDMENAIKYYKKASDFRNPLGNTMLGFIYYYGRGVDKDYSLAFKYFTKGSLDHEYHSILKLSDMYKLGQYVNQNYNYALDYIEPLFNEGMNRFLKGEYKNNPVFDCAMRYADAYKDGLGYKKNLEEALNYYTFAYNGFVKQMKYDKYETYNKLKYCLNNLENIKKELNKVDESVYDVLDFVFDKSFKFSFDKEDNYIILNFKFNEKEIFNYPQLNKTFVLDNVSLKFSNISEYNKIEYDELRPIDYVIKGNTLRLYDEESTLMHFNFDKISSNIKKTPNFYDLILCLEKGNVVLHYDTFDEEILIDHNNQVTYKLDHYKNIDDFILNCDKLRDNFSKVLEIR